MWAYETSFYQIYPLGFCGAPKENDGITVNRLNKLHSFIPHLNSMGIGAVYFCPLLQSDNHGYDTRDFGTVDCRLGTNEDFAMLCGAFHKYQIKVVLDGVFNHVGRGFWAFQDVLKNRENSPYLQWFHVNLQGNNGYNDGLWYEGWEGHYELVRLNLQNPAVVDHLLENVGHWIDQFDIDGLRIDVAYMLDETFLRQLRAFCEKKKADFLLIGEMIHGDYNRLLRYGLLHSVTNYECYKWLHVAFNDLNMYEIAHSLQRQFGTENWTLYQNKHLLNFADNHDVSRLASVIKQQEHLKPLYALLFAIPGIPCLYYGSEWGATGEKMQGDAALRPAFDAPEETDLTAFITSCIKAKADSPALNYGDYVNLQIQNKFFVFERRHEEERVIVAINASDSAEEAHFNAGADKATDLLTGQACDFGGGVRLEPYTAYYWRLL